MIVMMMKRTLWLRQYRGDDNWDTVGYSMAFLKEIPCLRSMKRRLILGERVHSGFNYSVPLPAFRNLDISFILKLCKLMIDIDKLLATLTNDFGRNLSISIVSWTCFPRLSSLPKGAEAAVGR